ncbi:MAG: non-hydrolyzing UDP-N-acetylglucosamine 2-epimerase [Thermodesulfobacteriota bacterium]
MKILVIFGTRPEAIKFASLIHQLNRSNGDFSVKVCVTSQHVEMLYQVLIFFGIRPDYDLKIMKPNQSLFDVTAESLRGLESVIRSEPFDLLFVQGDTTTTMVGALAGYYQKVKVAHLEAGLRSGDKLSPYPEEMNRRLVGQIANYHFAPTTRASINLKREGIKENIWVVGNTAIDSLFLCLDLIRQDHEQSYYRFFKTIDFSKKIILVTGHRRESFGRPFENICGALKEIAASSGDVEIVYPVHLNPNIKEVVYPMLQGLPNIRLMGPLEYNRLVWLMNKSYLVLTDSGGIQEEAPSLGKPVLVMREVTERTEGIDAGTAKLVGTEKERIIDGVSVLLQDKDEYEKMAKATNPYGDGEAAPRILRILPQLEMTGKS